MNRIERLFDAVLREARRKQFRISGEEAFDAMYDLVKGGKTIVVEATDEDGVVSRLKIEPMTNGRVVDEVVIKDLDTFDYEAAIRGDTEFESDETEDYFVRNLDGPVRHFRRRHDRNSRYHQFKAY